MATSRITRLAGRGLLLAGLGLGVAGCSSGSSRSDYYAARSILHPSESGDGSVIAIGPGAGAWAESLTLMPLGDSGDLADSR
ncbi:MAG TPA: hypothetical protein VFF69_00805 [Phycisphaerales bacterium]|nr:hypothetical protein [Phycisphaerales bacterium]